MNAFTYDVGVVGGGAAGVAAALASARAGAKTLLIDPAPGPAGTVVDSGLTTLCGLYVSDGLERPVFVNEGLPREIAESLMREDGVTGPRIMGRVAVLPYRGDSFRKVGTRMIEGEARLHTMWGTRLTGVEVEGAFVRRLTLSSGERTISLEIGAAIDATGTGLFAGMAGEGRIDSGASLLTPAIIFPLQQVGVDTTSRAEMVRVGLRIARALKSGEIEPGPTGLSLNPSLDSGQVTAKLNLGDISERFETADESGATEWANGRLRCIVDFLRRRVPGFERAEVPDETFKISRREGASLRGRYVLTGSDVLQARKSRAPACRGSWPVEQWDADGRLHYRFVPPGEAYDIPMDSLRSAKLDNLFFAGKCMSADVDALASVRVIGCCLATGEASGQASAEAIASGQFSGTSN